MCRLQSPPLATTAHPTCRAPSVRYLEAHGAQFELSRCPLLLSPAEWAAAKWGGGKAALAEGMLWHSPSTIHKPLTLIEPKGSETKKEAEQRAKLKYGCYDASKVVK